MKPSEDQLMIFENILRNQGAWCDHGAGNKFAHYMMCRHPRANIAISLCGTIIVPIEKLHENSVSQKCLPCALYLDARTEAKGKLYNTLLALTQENLNQTNQTKE